MNTCARYAYTVDLECTTSVGFQDGKSERTTWNDGLFHTDLESIPAPPTWVLHLVPWGDSRTIPTVEVPIISHRDWVLLQTITGDPHRPVRMLKHHEAFELVFIPPAQSSLESESVVPLADEHTAMSRHQTMLCDISHHFRHWRLNPRRIFRRDTGSSDGMHHVRRNRAQTVSQR
jgi:hypothetical protein